MNIHACCDPNDPPYQRAVQLWYNRLLVDICEVSGVSLDAPDDLSYDWLVSTGPQLDKQCLSCIEGNPDKPDLPDWILPLWDTFILTKDGKYLRWLRQLLLFCYKAEFEPTDDQIKKAQASFEEIDENIKVWDESFKEGFLSPVLFTSARKIIGSVIYRVDWSNITPHHGPGAVYPPRNPEAKSCFRTMYSSIQPMYPYDQFFCGLPSFWDRVLWKEDQDIRIEDTIQAKLSAVPKDSRGPRLICVHPCEAIWIQQGQRLLLENAIERSPLTRGRINFTDQSVNGDKALKSSESGYLCTLDLKEASDRISSELVRHLFGDYAYSVLSCSRASEIKLTDGRVHRLKKWAPMGNALCFPVQSLVFFSLVQAGIRCRYGINCNDIYVFGDDILFPVKYYDGAIRGLVTAGLVPNMAKTFRKGLFRESCGVDAYNGKDVTPLRIRKTSASLIQDACSLTDLAKRLRRKGYERCAASIYSSVSKAWGVLPLCNNPHCQGLVEYVERDLGWLMLNERKLRFRRSTHQWSVPTRMVKNGCKSVSMGDWYHLQDSLLRIARMGDVISDRGTEYPYPYRELLTYGWSDCGFRP